MKPLSHSILLLICLTVLYAIPDVFGQDNQTNLIPNDPLTFPLSLGEKRSFTLQMKEDDFAEIVWIVNYNIRLNFKIFDSENKDLSKIYAVDESVLFIAPKDDKYTLVVEFEKQAEIDEFEKPPSGKQTGISEKQNISLEYNNKFKLPAGTEQNSIRKINGYDIKILTTPENETADIYPYSIVLFEKNGMLKRVLRSNGGLSAGFSFSEDLSFSKEYTYTKETRRSIDLIEDTLDKTGDKVPDVMLEFYSGGNHCCSETYFINLGDSIELVEKIFTGSANISAIRKNPKGGLIFATRENSFVLWNTSYTGSPYPLVILEFRNGLLRPNFRLMKKPPPSLLTLKKKAYAIHKQLSPEPYLGADNFESAIYKDDFRGEPVFWGLMLDLIYSGNEDLAWQYLDLIWSPQKQGKKLFIREFKSQLTEGHFWKMIQADKEKNKK